MPNERYLVQSWVSADEMINNSEKNLIHFSVGIPREYRERRMPTNVTGMCVMMLMGERSGSGTSGQGFCGPQKVMPCLSD